MGEGPYYSSRSQGPRMRRLSQCGQEQPALPFRLLPSPTCTAPAPWEVGREVSPGYREEEPCWGRSLGSDHAQGVTVIGPHHLPRGGTWWGLEGGHQRPAMVLLPASGKRQNSQSLLGKVFDIHILVLGQLLQDGLDFTLQCAVVKNGSYLL